MAAPFIDSPDEVAVLGRARAEQHWALHDRLVARLNEGELAAQIDALTREVAAVVDCSACGRCCQRMGPEIDDETARRLAAALDLSVGELRQQLLRPMWPGAPAAEQRWLLPDPCPLHDGLLCTIYEHRPRVCRDFPCEVGSSSAERLRIFVETARICPITYNVLERLAAA